MAAASSPNAILTSNQQQGTNGTPSFIPVAPYKYIGLQDFDFGCGLHDDNAVAGEAVQCTIFVNGFAAGSDQEVATADFTFTPPTVSVASAPMIHAVLPSSFTSQKIVNVTVVQDNSLTETLLIGTYSRIPPSFPCLYIRCRKLSCFEVLMAWEHDMLTTRRLLDNVHYFLSKS